MFVKSVEFSHHNGSTGVSCRNMAQSASEGADMVQGSAFHMPAEIMC